MTTKERIIELAADKGLTKAALLKKAGIPRGLLDSDKMEHAVSDKQLMAIHNAFPDVSLEWLVTGLGCMYRPTLTLPPDVVSLDRYENLVRENERLRLQATEKSQKQ